MRIFSKGLDEIVSQEYSGPLKERLDVWFGLFQNKLMTDSGHYLCYGSEYLAGLATGFDHSQYGRHHDLLLRTGKPTIFFCDVPIHLVPDVYLDNIQEYFDLCDGFCIHENLSPEFIVKHLFPKQAYNPLCGNRLRKF
jgi:hypothetical protein